MAFSDLVIKTVAGGNYVLVRPLTWKLSNNKTISVPVGFTTDLASVPRGFRWLITGHSHTRKPAVVHDYLYAKGYTTRKEADLLFRKGMRDTNTPAWKREAAYLGVRVGGWVSWNRYRHRA